LNEIAFVDDRDFPGGPGAFDTEENSIPFVIVGTGAYMVNTWLADTLLLFRYSLFTGKRWWAIVPPTCVFIVSIVSGCILLAELAVPGARLFSDSTVNYALIFWWTDIAATILLTVVIVSRLLYIRWKLRKIIDSSDLSPYVSISAMLLESAFLYTAWAILFIVTYAKGLNLYQLFYQPMGQIQSIAPLLIILRVAQGRAITREKLSETQSMSLNIANQGAAVTDMRFAERSLSSLRMTSVGFTRSSTPSSTAADTNRSVAKLPSVSTLGGHGHPPAVIQIDQEANSIRTFIL